MKNYDEYAARSGLKEEYSRDGAVNPDIWARSSCKVLFFLKENYGYQGCGIIDIKDKAHKWLSDGNKTYKKCAALAAAIHLGIEHGRILSENEVHSVANDRVALINALDRTAVVNIKKSSGKSTSDDRAIRAEAARNSQWLNEQIQCLSPTVIIAGGTVCWHGLTRNLRLFNLTQDCSKNSAIRIDGIVLCHSNHPAAWRGGGFNIFILQETIIKAVIGVNNT
jgi:hypothetical protein